MSEIRIESIKIKNYRSFGNEEQIFTFPDEDYKKPIAIIGYNNAGKTNLMNAILYTLGVNFVSKDTFSINDFHYRKIQNVPEILLYTSSSSEEKFDGESQANLNGYHKLLIYTDGNEIAGCKIQSLNSLQKTKYDKDDKNFGAFGATRYFNIFYINFHKIKEEISTTKTSWGNLKSFLAKHIKKLVEKDNKIAENKANFKKSLKALSDEAIQDSQLNQFINRIKDNYSKNLRENKCHIEFSLPEYEDIFLQMVFKIGLNEDNQNLIPIDHFGDGYISMFVMAVIQAIAENKNDKCLFLFEEPESFLHENHQEYFYKVVLCELAEKGHQVIYTTHSDRMVNIFDTRSFIRLEFDEKEKQTLCKYNNFKTEFLLNPIKEEEDSGFSLSEYNSVIKNIEPNLNKILFSRKVVLVEGPNDLMVYKYIIQRSIENLGKNPRFAETYLSFKNFVIIPHHGKSTAYLLAQLCKHVGVDYFLINDWDFEEDFQNKLGLEFDDLKKETDLWGEIQAQKNSKGKEYSEKTLKSMFAVNKTLKANSTNDQIHFNIPKLEKVINYDSDDKDSMKIWKRLQSKKSFDEAVFPDRLKTFLEINQIQSENIINLEDLEILFETQPAINNPLKAE
jgi:putative ATP-dependent endonuclease of OLD family